MEEYVIAVQIECNFVNACSEASAIYKSLFYLLIWIKLLLPLEPQSVSPPPPRSWTAPGTRPASCMRGRLPCRRCRRCACRPESEPGTTSRVEQRARAVVEHRAPLLRCIYLYRASWLLQLSLLSFYTVKIHVQTRLTYTSHQVHKSLTLLELHLGIGS